MDGLGSRCKAISQRFRVHTTLLSVCTLSQQPPFVKRIHTGCRCTWASACVTVRRGLSCGLE